MYKYTALSPLFLPVVFSIIKSLTSRHRSSYPREPWRLRRRQLQGYQTDDSHGQWHKQSSSSSNCTFCHTRDTWWCCFSGHTSPYCNKATREGKSTVRSTQEHTGSSSVLWWSFLLWTAAVSVGSLDTILHHCRGRNPHVMLSPSLLPSPALFPFQGIRGNIKKAIRLNAFHSKILQNKINKNKIKHSCFEIQTTVIDKVQGKCWTSRDWSSTNLSPPCSICEIATVTLPLTFFNCWTHYKAVLMNKKKIKSIFWYPLSACYSGGWCLLYKPCNLHLHPMMHAGRIMQNQRTLKMFQYKTCWEIKSRRTSRFCWCDHSSLFEGCIFLMHLSVTQCPPQHSVLVSTKPPH